MRTYKFEGTLTVEGDVDLEALKDYMADNTFVDLEGKLSDTAEVLEWVLNWETLGEDKESSELQEKGE